MSNRKKDNAKLPVLVGINVADIQRRLMELSTITERLIFLDRVIGQTEIENGLAMWDADCYNCVQQFRSKPAWEGVFDAVHGDNKIEGAINADAYQFGQLHYRNFIELKQLREAVEKGKDISSNQPKPESLLIEPLTEKQYKELADYANKFRLFRAKINEATMQALLIGQLPEPLISNSNIKVATLFNQLQTSGYIIENWKNLIQRSKYLKGRRKIENKPDDPFLTANDLSVAYGESKQHEPYYKELEAILNRWN